MNDQKLRELAIWYDFKGGVEKIILLVQRLNFVHNSFGREHAIGKVCLDMNRLIKSLATGVVRTADSETKLFQNILVVETHLNFNRSLWCGRKSSTDQTLHGSTYAVIIWNSCSLGWCGMERIFSFSLNVVFLTLACFLTAI